jgi:hypothetical protein
MPPLGKRSVDDMNLADEIDLIDENFYLTLYCVKRHSNPQFLAVLFTAHLVSLFD